MTLSETTTAPMLTSAQVLGALYRELHEEGVGGDLANDIVRDAAHSMFAEDGIGVLTPEASA